MAPCVVSFGHDIEEERFNIVIQSLVVQEEFGQQTQVLTVNLRGRASLETQLVNLTFLLGIGVLRSQFKFMCMLEGSITSPLGSFFLEPHRATADVKGLSSDLRVAFPNYLTLVFISNVLSEICK